ncbi:acetamidase/formamidase family protein [Microbacterium sp. Marseille-Q6965]|uniref:acetamidase/formamidase family protein n=1 Tax=Microbacterium sp. Marseille-Q6965 TaxID=2965072 RepID=UPI0028E0A45C|nr:acetamidase/formamidase family protein [Microbacterium sp. Marseille-Q6965]
MLDNATPGHHAEALPLNRYGTGPTPQFAPVPILQPGVFPPHDALPEMPYVPVTPETVLWGRLPSRRDAPVVTIASGDTIIVDTLSHEGLLPDQGQDPAAFFAQHGVPRDAVLRDAIAVAASTPRDAVHDGPHVITGPIRVEGARPGDLLRIAIERLEPRVPYGVISNRHGRGALPAELPRSGRTVSVFTPVEERAGALRGVLPRVEGAQREVAFPLAPFLGAIGVAPDSDERPHSVPPSEFGGNIDIKLLVEGTAIYLPVQVDGALAYVGDPHFAQGDGEVALTAVEASLRATLRFDVVPAARAHAEFGRVKGPLVETDEYLVPTGLDPDLNEAMRKATRAALDLLRARWGMAEHLAYAYLSAAVDFDISQVVDGTCGVHARIRTSDLSDSVFAARPARGPGAGGSRR